jgi:hypothetical protein
VKLADGVVEVEELAGQDRNGVLQVVDVRHLIAEIAIDPVGEGSIPDPGQAVANHPHIHGRVELDPEVDGIEERYRRAERVAYDGDA